MMKCLWLQRLGLLSGLAVVLALLVPASAEAQVVRVSRGESRNAISFNLGYFSLLGEDSRDEEDVLLADLVDLDFEVKDFNGAIFGGEWLFGVGDYLEGGLGIGFYQRTVPSVYRDITHAGGREIEQDLKLRVVPMTATIRFLPVGRGNAVEPYVGAGVGIFNWRYSEVGEFVDSNDLIFADRFIAEGTAVGPVVLAGLRAPVGDAWAIGGEIRWQRAKGDTTEEPGLLGTKIDLGGWSTSFTLGLRF